MKLNIKYLLILSLAVFTACEDDFLERYPLSEITPENSFSTEADLELYTNSFYSDLPGQGGIIQSDLRSDNILYNGVPFEQTGERVIPGEAGSNGWSWGDLRKINIFFEYYENCPDEEARLTYSGVAHFFRAWFYFDKLKRFGAVPFYDRVIGTGDEDLLLKERDSREFVTDRIIEDLDAAIANLGTAQTVDRVSRWTALAFKSRVCLFEGTFRKYHGLDGGDDLLTQAAEAAGRVINESPYRLYSTGNANSDYRDLFASSNAREQEVMLTRRYNSDLNVVNNVNYYFTSPTQQDVSLTKSIVDTYLTSGGAPFTSLPGSQTMMFDQETANRDPRLAQTIRTPGYTRIGGDGTELLPDFSVGISGYQIVKYLLDESQDGFEASFQDLPIIRYGEVLLNYAEAKAEMGTLTQGDLDQSVNALRQRVGMPFLNLANANTNVDPILQSRYSSVSGSNLGVLLEIRRERRVELVMEGFRYDDLMRWKAGNLLENHFQGMYFPGLGTFDLDGDGNDDIELFQGSPTTGLQPVEIGGVLNFSNGNSGNIVPFADRTKSFDESRDYLYPIPSGDILLNPNLSQNPNWE